MIKSNYNAEIYNLFFAVYMATKASSATRLYHPKQSVLLIFVQYYRED